MERGRAHSSLASAIATIILFAPQGPGCVESLERATGLRTCKPMRYVRKTRRHTQQTYNLEPKPEIVFLLDVHNYH